MLTPPLAGKQVAEDDEGEREDAAGPDPLQHPARDQRAGMLGATPATSEPAQKIPTAGEEGSLAAEPIRQTRRRPASPRWTASMYVENAQG